MTHLVKDAPPFNKQNPTISKRHHQRRAMTISLTINLVIVDALMMPLPCCGVVLMKGWRIFYQMCHNNNISSSSLIDGFCLLKGGASFTKLCHSSEALGS
jgi:hypothetical protein